jgi:hypothetical protein
VQPLNAKLWPVGAWVELPSGRKASILGYTDEGRLRLRYLGGNAVDGLVDLYPHHCRRLAKSETPG